MGKFNKIFLAIFSLVLSREILAEDSPSAIVSLSATSEPSQVSSPIDDEDVPLDAWIIKKKIDPSPAIQISPSPSISTEASPTASIDELTEDKRVYKALLEEQRREQEEGTSTNKKKGFKNEGKQHALHVFKKTALSKYDQSRIDKIKQVQKTVIAEQKREFADLLSVKKSALTSLRLCVLSYPAMGLPSEVKKIDPKIISANITADWKNGLKLLVQNECNIVLYHGIYGKTNAKSIEFFDKTMDFLKKATAVSWKQVLNPSQANTYFAVIYDPNAIEIGSVESLSGITLRRGGPFKEDNFSIVPLEVNFIKKDEANPKKYTLITFDLRDTLNPLKKLKIHYQMQMASALLEASINRINSIEDSNVILAGSIGENRKHPAFQILQGAFSPVDFLEGKACKLTEDQADKFSCDRTKLLVEPRTLLGVFTDLSHLMNKTTQIAVDKNIEKLTAEVFLSNKSLESAKNEKNKLIGASLDVIKGKQFEYSFLYVDLLGGDKE